ncbi:MAG: hypothetical protein QOD09_2936 [Bradyrhizobium sp.]|jgi:hypothetical protein|nr:hypothetical protein [Bradyrhizobium sp.]
MHPSENYQPSPIDIEGITLPSELASILERLAEHVHDLWALRKMEAKWRWSPQCSDVELTHSDLVPYSALSEDKKELDRVTARGTLLAILALGYRIIPPAQPIGDREQKRE